MTEKKFAVINPCKICQPMGAIFALMGVKNSMPLIHGSHGCSTYMRFQLGRHFKEAVNVASSSMSEANAVLGGEENLKHAIRNVSRIYGPEIIGVTTSCLSETIGDDVEGIIRLFKTQNDDLPEIVPISTPSYKHTHVEGYDSTVKALVENLATPSKPNSKLNVITGMVSPGDIAETKRILREMGIESIILTDTSESMDAPFDGEVSFVSSAGTTVEELKDTANSFATISLCKHANSAAKFLHEAYGLKSVSPYLPIGLQSTDEFMNELCKLTNKEIPEQITRERGKLIDAMIDAHQHNFGRKVAIYGDPDVVVGFTRFVLELGMIPSIVCTGSESKTFVEDIKAVTKDSKHKPVILAPGDLYDLHQEIKKSKVDLLIGNSYGSRIAGAENIPLLRMGFPIYDRVGAQRITCVGYTAGVRLVDTITNTILDRYFDEFGWALNENTEVDHGEFESSNCIN
ncbi:nitrogenase component 1 [Methanococcus maripaludis]|uniref:Nitrogenase molybdenum-iron protein beta chain/nitrogenase molybdenum-iron protein NifN n=1 Tax=Methanococcus maripaludis TaxID=39152 RepID=A0A8T4H0F7_METMI|nr:nitrogenase component 1 [Methanococcus maripaludis]MBM7408886.1 nitrogenase molybdenum-iron protein beta chain/nitrogenase molybdenum-iron protein NifN [Methanococcus maripaludis]MBP2218927.1 nitrogenase molybdenum-iron protein beta chain/nitrogenase molybdenum-iron protein NifN [Methanococcus maripaludis]